MCTCVPSPGGVAPVQSIPGGKAFGSPERVAVPPALGDAVRQGERRSREGTLLTRLLDGSETLVSRETIAANGRRQTWSAMIGRWLLLRYTGREITRSIPSKRLRDR